MKAGKLLIFFYASVFNVYPYESNAAKMKQKEIFKFRPFSWYKKKEMVVTSKIVIEYLMIEFTQSNYRTCNLV